jgi:ABC-type dipeptide/oligopeptide/nickel transport system permease subunit
VIEVVDEDPVEPTGTQRFISRFLHDRVAMAGAVFVLLVVVIALLAPEVAPYSPTANFPVINAGPSAAHWLGTDDIGRDLLSRVIFGARISLEAATIVVVLALLISVPIGLVAGYFSGRTDNVLMRLMDAMFAFPPLILAITVAALLGRSLHNESIAIAITSPLSPPSPGWFGARCSPSGKSCTSRRLAHSVPDLFV